MRDFISKALMVPRLVVDRGFERPFSNYRVIDIPKKSGGERRVFNPAPELKMIQIWLAEAVFSLFPVSQIALAYRKNTSILNNAAQHREFNYSVRVDINNFFESIRFQDLKSIFVRHENSEPRIFIGEERLFFEERFHEEVIMPACFLKDGRLPIGYASSPIISNVVMEPLDEGLLVILRKELPSSSPFCLTRYADDFVFSTNEKGRCKDFLRIFNSFLSDCSFPKLTINHKKTRFMSRKGGSTLVTGLKINSEGRVGVHSSYRDHIRLLLKLYRKGGLESRDLNALPGHLNFVRYVDPALFTKLSFRYSSEIEKIMNGN